MRTSDERVAELHRRMRERRQMKERRRYRLISISAAAAGIILVIFFAALVSETPVTGTVAANGGFAASIFSDHAMLGCVVVALLSFCLGALVTVLCYRLKNRSKDGEEFDDRDL